MRTTHRVGIAALAGLALVAPALMTSSAEANSGDLVAHLRPVALNGVDGGGTAWVTVRGRKIEVSITASGLLAGAPHAAHIHFGATARHECPLASDDTDGSGTLNTSEGGPAYGPVVVSLTKTGDTGTLTYQRGHIKVSQTVAKAISEGQAVIVIHGVDHDGSGDYSGTTPSDLNPALPTEATDPALCGAVR